MKTQLFLLILCINVQFIFGQQVLDPHRLTPTNGSSFGDNKFWFSVDPMLHVVYQYDGFKLTSYDYVNKKQAWEVMLPGYKPNHIELFTNRPYIKFNKTKMFAPGPEMAAAVSRVTGEIVFNTEDLPDYEPSELFYSKDGQYVLSMLKEKIKRDKKKGIERQIFKHISLVKLGESKKLWTETMPEPEADILGLKDRNIGFEPIANKDIIVFSYGGVLYGFDVQNGSVKWQSNLNELIIEDIRLAPLKDQKYFVAVNKAEDGNFSIDFRAFETGEPNMDLRFDLGHYYNIKFNTEAVMVRSANGFNYLNYDGSTRWTENVPTPGKIEKIYVQDDQHLVVMNVSDKFLVNWIDPDGQMTFEESIPIESYHLRDGILMEDYLVLVTDKEISTFSINNGQRITNIPLMKHEPFCINKEQQSVVYSQKKGKAAYILPKGAKEPHELAEKKFFERGNDTIRRIESFDNHYALLSENEMVQFNADGKEIKRIFYKPPSKIAGILVPLAAIALGTILADEVRKINNIAYQQGLKDWDDFETDVNLYTLGGSGDFGFGLIAGAETLKAAESFGLYDEKAVNPYENLAQTWFVRDKIDNLGWGLRLVDLKNGEETVHIPLHDKNFIYSLDEIAQVVYCIRENEILFFDIADYIGN